MTAVQTKRFSRTSSARSSASASSLMYAKRCSSNSERDSRAIGTSNSVRRRARSNTCGVVDSYWKRPVSHTSAVYRQTAASRVSGRPISSISSWTTQPLAAASGSMTLIVP